MYFLVLQFLRADKSLKTSRRIVILVDAWDNLNSLTKKNNTKLLTSSDLSHVLHTGSDELGGLVLTSPDLSHVLHTGRDELGGLVLPGRDTSGTGLSSCVNTSCCHCTSCRIVHQHQLGRAAQSQLRWECGSGLRGINGVSGRRGGGWRRIHIHCGLGSRGPKEGVMEMENQRIWKITQVLQP